MESEKKYDISALKKAVDFAIETHEAVDLARADGKIDVTDAALLMKPSVALFALIGVITQVHVQFADLDEEEKAELKKYVQDEYDIADDNVERIVEKAFAMAVDLGDLIHDVVTGDDH